MGLQETSAPWVDCQRGVVGGMTDLPRSRWLALAKGVKLPIARLLPSTPACCRHDSSFRVLCLQAQA